MTFDLPGVSSSIDCVKWQEQWEAYGQYCSQSGCGWWWWARGLPCHCFWCAVVSVGRDLAILARDAICTSRDPHSSVLLQWNSGSTFTLVDRLSIYWRWHLFDFILFNFFIHSSLIQFTVLDFCVWLGCSWRLFCLVILWKVKRKSASMALRTYGDKPISFQIEEGGDFYCVGSEVTDNLIIS